MRIPINLPRAGAASPIRRIFAIGKAAGSLSWPPALRRALHAAALMLLLAALGACEPDAAESPAFRIGVMESLTGAGETYGTVAIQAKTLAVEEINAAGGIDGRPLSTLR